MIRLFAWGFLCGVFFTTIIIIVELTQSTFYYVCKVNNRGPAFEASFPKEERSLRFEMAIAIERKKKNALENEEKIGVGKRSTVGGQGIDSRLAGKPGQTLTQTGTRF